MRLAFFFALAVSCFAASSVFPAAQALAASDVCLPLMRPGVDGRVNVSQLREALVASFRLKDADHDGRLSLEEYLANAREVFLEMEGKTRGAISLEEFTLYRCGKPEAAGGKTLACPPLTGQAGLTAQMDVNRDGGVEPAECRAVWGAEFALLDANRDARLDLQEFLAGQRARYARMDLQGDSAVTLDEYLAFELGAPR